MLPNANFTNKIRACYTLEYMQEPTSCQGGQITITTVEVFQPVYDQAMDVGDAPEASLVFSVAALAKAKSFAPGQPQSNRFQH